MKRLTPSIIAAVVISLATAAAADMADLPYEGEGHVMVNASDLTWGDVASMAPGAEIAVIEGELSEKEPFTFRLKLPANYRIDPHVHPEFERVTVLSGKLHFGHGKEFDRTKTSQTYLKFWLEGRSDKTVSRAKSAKNAKIDFDKKG